MSKCVKCGKELVCDIPTEIKFKGESVIGMASAPHGCPKEYDHFIIAANKIGIDTDGLKNLFDRLSSGNDTIHHTTYEDGSDDFESGQTH